MDVLMNLNSTTTKPLNQNKMKQTAVEWLFEQLPTIDKYDPFYADIFNQAKEMEKEQIKNAWLNSLTKGDYNSADEYYNETYKSEQ
jgi:hypothetical protein